MTDEWKRDRVGAALRGENPTVLARLEAGFAVMGDVQFLPGYCVFITDTPGVDRLTDLPRARRHAFLAGAEMLAEAVRNDVWRPVALHPIERWGSPLPHTVLGPQHDDLRRDLTKELVSLSDISHI
ncbi:MAG TPA: diadenosine tetraphosphate hydrolase [Nocardioidaceae bacterium]|nr:diadenosine tetraphosphate hydrolase [Nocardioidaceae bacterium]